MDRAIPGNRPAASGRAAPAIELRLFGAPQLTGDAAAAHDAGDAGNGEATALAAQPKRFALLVYLALAQPHGFQRRDRLLALFWPELDQTHARASLRKAVHVLRRALGEAAIESRGDDELRLTPNAMRCDVLDFDDAIAAGRLARALELYRGELLDGFFVNGASDFELWLSGERTRRREQAATAAWTLAQRYETDAELTMATQWARRAAALLPGDERTLRRIIMMLDRAGDRAGAMRVYQDFARRLAAELEVEPSPETKALVEAVRSRS